MTLKAAYWYNTGTHQELMDRLQGKIPGCGSVTNPSKNKELERLRKMICCYYDLYNNDLYNRRASFNRLFVRASEWKYTGREVGQTFSDLLFTDVEAIINAQVLKAAEEQELYRSIA